jgi:hypothetical protein
MRLKNPAALIITLLPSAATFSADASSGRRGNEALRQTSTQTTKRNSFPSQIEAQPRQGKFLKQRAWANLKHTLNFTSCSSN